MKIYHCDECSTDFDLFFIEDRAKPEKLATARCPNCAKIVLSEVSSKIYVARSRGNNTATEAPPRLLVNSPELR